MQDAAITKARFIQASFCRTVNSFLFAAGDYCPVPVQGLPGGLGQSGSGHGGSIMEEAAKVLFSAGDATA